MAALNFGAGNTTRRLTTTDLTPLPSTGWTVITWFRHRAADIAAQEVFVGFGTGGAASSFQIKTFGVPDQYGVQARDASGANVTAGALFPADGDYLFAARYDAVGGSLETYLIAKGATASGVTDSSGAAYATITPGTGWYIGGDGTSWMQNPLGEVAVVGRALTLAEINLLAKGFPVTAVEPQPLLYWTLRGGARGTEPNLGVSGSAGDATLVGSGYATEADFFTVASTYSSVPLRGQAAEVMPNSALYDVRTWWQQAPPATEKWFADELPMPAGSSSGAVGRADETDTAFALARVQIKPVGLATEADTALALTLASARPTGLSAEADTALALARLQIRAAGRADETDAALALGRVQIRAVGLASETEVALALAPVAIRAAGMATETDVALALSGGLAVGRADETDTALALVPKQVGAVGMAVEVDTAIACGGVLIRSVGLASETDSAIACAPVQVSAAGLASESDTAFALAAVQKLLAGVAAEADTAFARPPAVAGGLSPQHRAWLFALARVHGLIDPLVVTETSRTDGVLLQTLSLVGGVTTVTPVSVPSDVAGASALTSEEADLLEALVRAHGLIDPLEVSAAGRTDGTLVQTANDVAGTVTLTRTA